MTLSGGSALRHVVRRTSPVALPSLTAPPVPAGTRSVVLNAPGQSPGRFDTLRNLTLNGGVGPVTVPAGTYGTFTANGSSGFTIGIAGATEPAVYNFQGLTLNGGTALRVVGPVVVTVGGAVVFNGTAGAAGHPEWLHLDVPSGGVTLNGGVTVHGFVTAPNGTVMINGTLRGGVAADRLTVNGGGGLKAQ